MLYQVGGHRGDAGMTLESDDPTRRLAPNCVDELTPLDREQHL